jgi:hypothetical protein
MSTTNTYDKMMQASAMYILGESTGVKIKGSAERVQAFQEVVVASRTLYEALCDQKPMSVITQLIEAKRSAAENFKRITGNTWSL